MKSIILKAEVFAGVSVLDAIKDAHSLSKLLDCWIDIEINDVLLPIEPNTSPESYFQLWQQKKRRTNDSLLS